ncbi:esterase-like activity of phytase family protein [Elizabethkingia anophelis]|nr:esterase-like activity of phytase family protein [Elizabethkingia anophelis]MCT4194899.1 esterase-like activity of phytase family protein [Elizabethkingia anophelis]
MKWIVISILLSNMLMAQSAKMLDSYSIPSDALVNGKPFGGISGIDFDPKEKVYYLISDDRSSFDNARFYKADIVIKNKKIDTIINRSVVYLKNEYGGYFKKETIDPETIRLTKEGLLIIGNEGGNESIADIGIYDKNGVKKKKLTDSTISFQTRRNKSFEPISLYPKRNHFVFATESSLKTDGEESGFDSESTIRIIAQNYKSDKILWQASYPLGKIKQEYHNQYRQADIGLTEILMIDRMNFVALERSGIKIGENQFFFDCRLFWVKLEKNKDKQNPFKYKTIKKEIFRFAEHPDGIQNFEGLSFGPEINGHKTLLVVSDNNFSADYHTVFFLLEI